MNRSVRNARAALCLLVLLGIGMAPAQQQEVAPRVVLAKGQVRYVGPQIAAVSQDTPRGARKPAVAVSSLNALARHARYFGIADPDTDLRVKRSISRGAAGDIVRYQQLHRGIPVLGGELVLTLDGSGQLAALSGETAQALALATVDPVVAAEQATQVALAAVGKYHPDQRFNLTASKPELWVYDAKLVGPDTNAPARLVWRLEVSSPTPSRVRELVLVDAADGSVPLHFNQVHHALDLATYTANSSTALPGTLLCDETQPLCTGGVNLDADLAHRYTTDTYNFYLSHHGRDSFNNLGAQLVSTVRYYSASNCPNAFWDGIRMVYCAGAPAADDVVGHELTHAVTQYTSNLYYYYQAGAINESLSDIWGEFIDLTNGSGNDAPQVRWQMGEGWAEVGVIRDMANPPAYGQPDRMGSPLYYAGAEDEGGVHINSGVNNKAASLLVDGGSFNGRTVTGLGIDKVAALYYRVQTQHLTSGSDFADLYLALNQACRNMIGGAEGITGDDCQQVANATLAVEMNSTPNADAGSEAAICPIGQVPTDTFFDGAETSTDAARWSNVRLTGSSGTWGRVIGYSPQGLYAYYTPGVNGVSNHAWTLAQPVTVPTGALLHFRHQFDQEYSATTYDDGGILEYTTDAGATWRDAAPLYSAGKNYTGTISVTGAGNPAEGQPAFVGVSRGYVSTRYDLASLSGQPLRIRFRNTSDSSVFTQLAWIVDQVRIYTCGAGTPGTGNMAPTAVAGPDRTAPPNTRLILDASGSSDTDGYIVSAQWTQISGTQLALDPDGLRVGANVPLTPAQDTLVFRVTVLDNQGATATDDVTITVINQQPVANAGPDLAHKPRDVVTLQGLVTDGDGTVASRLWTQLDGTSVLLGRAYDRVWRSIPIDLAFTAGPVAAGTTMLRLRPQSALTNAGGTVPLLSSSDLITCIEGSTTTNCSFFPAQSLAVTGSLVAPASTNTTQPALWTLQNVQLSNGAPITGSFLYNASLQAITQLGILAPGAATDRVSFIAPSVASSGSLTFRLTGTDNSGGSATDEVTVTLTNQPPTANAGADRSAKPRQIVTLVGTAGDDSGVASVAWTQLSGPAVTLQAVGNASTTFTAPSVLASATLEFRMTVTDLDGVATADNVTVTLTNTAPIASAGADQAVRSRSTVTLAGVASDDTGVAGVVWMQVSGPTVVLSNFAAVTPTFTAPSVLSNVAMVFRLTVTDADGAIATDEVTVSAINQAPTANAGIDQAAKPRATISLVGVATDADDAVASVSWSQVEGPAVTLQNAGTTAPSFVAPSVVASAALVFRLTAADFDGAVTTDDVRITVTNVAPTVSSGADLTADPGKPVSLAGTAADPDGSITAYSWTQLSGPAVSLAGASSATLQFTAPSASTASTLSFQLAVTDNDGASAVDQVIVNVKAKKSGGGGGLDVWALFSLIGLLLIRTNKSRQAWWRLSSVR